MNQTKKYLLVLLLVFVVSRAFFFVLGVRFEGVENIYGYLQFIDPKLLTERFFESLYYSSFPPLYNVFIGVVLRNFDNPGLAFVCFNRGLALVLALSMFGIMLELGVSKKTSLITTCVFMILPPTILYENWLFYTYYLTAFLTLSAFFLIRFLRRPSLCDGMLLFSCYSLLTLVNTRFYYLPGIIVPLVILHNLLAQRLQGGPELSESAPPAEPAAGSAAQEEKAEPAPAAMPFFRQRWVRILLISLLPTCAVWMVCAKNKVVFGKFSVDTHFGFHMGNGLHLLSRTDPVIRKAYAEKYPIFLKLAMSPVEDLQGSLKTLPPTSIPILDNTKKSTGTTNHHCLYYQAVADMYSEEIKRFVWNEPALYLRFVVKSVINYVLPSNQYEPISKKNRVTIDRFDSCYLAFYPLILLVYLAALGICAVMVIQTGMMFLRQLTSRPISQPANPMMKLSLVQWSSVLYLLGIIVYNALPLLVCFGENNRYKFSTEPALFILAAMVIDRYLRTRRPAAVAGNEATP